MRRLHGWTPDKPISWWWINSRSKSLLHGRNAQCLYNALWCSLPRSKSARIQKDNYLYARKRAGNEPQGFKLDMRWSSRRYALDRTTVWTDGIDIGRNESPLEEGIIKRIYQRNKAIRRGFGLGACFIFGQIQTSSNKVYLTVTWRERQKREQSGENASMSEDLSWR